MLWNRIKDKLLIIDRSLDETLNLITQILNRNIRNDINELYAACFTENDDLVQNWRGYGEQGEGFALGFSKEIFDGIQEQCPFPNATADKSTGWGKVHYDIYNNNELDEILIKQCCEILNNSQDFESPLLVYETLKSYSPFIKNPTFKDEREIRIVCYAGAIGRDSFSSSVVKFDSLDTSHCSIGWLGKGKCALKKIIIGPSNGKEKANIKDDLEKNGIVADIEIVKSACSYNMQK